MPLPYWGEIRWFAGSADRVPAGWLPCDGRLVSADDFPFLHQAIHFSFGGSGSEFALPDLRGRIPVSTGQGIALAQAGGLEKVALTSSQMPAHTHTLAASKGDGDRGDPAGNVWARSESLGFSADAPDSALHAQSLATVGGGVAHENMMPFLGLTPMIAYDGFSPFDDAADADIYVGEVRIMAFDDPVPNGWLKCDGAAYSLDTHQALGDVIGTIYGGNSVPDLSGRVALHAGGAHPLAAKAGEASHLLSLAELPVHRHTALAAPVAGDNPSPAGRSWGIQTTARAYAAAPDVELRADAVAPAGGNDPHENRPPFLGLPHRIAHMGLIPVEENQDPLPEPVLGEVRIFAIPFVPDGWAACDGAVLPGDQNPVLLQVLGNRFGGDGVTSVGLPDLRDRAALGAGDGPGLTSRALGATGGAELVLLAPQHLPPHGHDVRARAASGGDASPEGHLFGASQARALSAGYASVPPAVPMSAEAVSGAGVGQPHNNMPPYLTLNFCIALIGLAQ